MECNIFDSRAEMRVGDDSGKSEEKSNELVERKWVLEYDVSSGNRQAEFQMSSHIVTTC